MITATITGNVGKTPELRMAKSGKQMANFSIASTEKKEGATTWVDVVCFDEQADVVSQSVQKGDVLGLVGNTGLVEDADARLHFELRYNNTPQDPDAWLGGP